AGGEGCYGAQQPLHPVELDRLKVIEGLNAVDHADGYASHDQACHSYDERDQGCGGQSKSALDVVELEIEGPVRGGQRARFAGSPEEVTEKRATHEFGGAAVAALHQAGTGRLSRNRRG